MTGPDHYREAARMLANADRHITEEAGDMRIAEVSAACAQVHATLALVCAVGMQHEAYSIFQWKFTFDQEPA